MVIYCLKSHFQGGKINRKKVKMANGFISNKNSAKNGKNIKTLAFAKID